MCNDSFTLSDLILLVCWYFPGFYAAAYNDFVIFQKEAFLWFLDQNQDGRSGCQAWGTTVHQWSVSEEQCSCAGLLPHLCFCTVRSYSWHLGSDWTVWFHLLFPGFISPLSAAHTQGWTKMEQMLQVPSVALHWGPCWRAFYLHPVLDFPLWDGACVLEQLTEMWLNQLLKCCLYVVRIESISEDILIIFLIHGFVLTCPSTLKVPTRLNNIHIKIGATVRAMQHRNGSLTNETWTY